MSSRKALSKKVRFEVFKRDSFTCQYCGRKAPEVVLNVDHIDPVAKGGCSDIINLITACFDCNSGKKDRKISDNSVVTKQIAQLAELQERRTQLQMMLDWREDLREIDIEKVEIVKQEIVAYGTPYSPNEHGIKKISSWTKKFDISEILDAVETSFDQYIFIGEDGKPTQDSWEKAFNFIPRIIVNKRNFSDKPYMKDVFYIRGILRNRCNYINEWKCVKMLEIAHKSGLDLEEFKLTAKEIKNWDEFLLIMQEMGIV